jgi:Endosomal/lysosomal potassium channel TMEM175
MPQRRATVERLGTFSDGVFAVLITIMVLELKPPEQPTFAALSPLWPTALSYAVSYAFIAIVWVNHHHLLRLTNYPSPRLIWINFAHLFMVSLVPFSTAWVARTRLAAVPVFVYAGVCHAGLSRVGPVCLSGNSDTGIRSFPGRGRGVCGEGRSTSSHALDCRTWGSCIVCRMRSWLVLFSLVPGVRTRRRTLLSTVNIRINFICSTLSLRERATGPFALRVAELAHGS